MSDETVTSFREGHAACPFVAFEDDRDHRAESPDYRHRCFASAEPEPRALPHQERFCLSAAFAACPIFLDWARQEAAGVATKSPSAASIEEPAPRTPVKVSSEKPAFLAGLGRTTPAEAAPVAPHSADPGSGLWGFEGAPRRTIPAATAAVHASVAGASGAGSSTPAYSMARRGPTRPDWENPPRMDNYPRLRARDDRNNNQPLLLAALGVAVLMVVLIVYPLMSGGGGNNNPVNGPSSSASHPGGSGDVPSTDVTPSPTPEAQPTFMTYTVKNGDTLTRIAGVYNITPDLIIQANLGTIYEIKNPNRILVGQKMFIPWATWIPPTVSPTDSPTANPTPTPKATPAPTTSLGY
jgi:LysM repeat protein